MNRSEIARKFSNGQFEEVFEFIDDDAKWVVVGEKKWEGKQAIIKNCKNVGAYFKSVTTRFNTLNIISEDYLVVINGTAEFIRDGKTVSIISACDLYEFNDDNKIKSIASYCIKTV